MVVNRKRFLASACTTVESLCAGEAGRYRAHCLDPFHLACVAGFAQWGLEPSERMCNAFDGGMIHLHSNGLRLLLAVATPRGLRAICFVDEVGHPAAIDLLTELKARTSDVPLSVFANYEKFVERLNCRELPGGVLYKVKNVLDILLVNRLMEKVQRYRV